MTSTVLLSSLRRARPRFARSINIERDTGALGALESFLPVGRALEVVGKLSGALAAGVGEAAFAVTGPYGSGKSSLALLLDALFAPTDSGEYQVARQVMGDASPIAVGHLEAARALASDRGFLRCFATAQREPVGITVLRALAAGLNRADGPPGLDTFRKRVQAMLDESAIDARSIAELVSALAAEAPLVLLIDEFGKSLEAVASGDRAGDLFLLQQLAENSVGARYAIVTLQHMGLGDYAAELDSNQRREWAKVQGRFEEIAYVEGAAQTLALVAAAFEPPEDQLAARLAEWSSASAYAAAELGFGGLDAALLAAVWPLHPLTLVVLPELVTRYGQNERTLFSFLASPGRRSVPEWLSRRELPVAGLPWVGLDRLYDYFVEAATAMSGYSAAASRWVEIDTRIRDARGLDPAQTRVLKTVGVLNLVAAGGELRARRGVLRWVLADGEPGTENALAVDARLAELEGKGLLSWRDFSDEFRVWQGTDFDVRSAIERMRAQIRALPAAELLDRNLPVPPLVAARHSHHTSTLRTFECRWSESALQASDLVLATDADGLVLFTVGATPTVEFTEADVPARPVVVLALGEADGLLSAVQEMEALRELREQVPEHDWVVRREIDERLAETRAILDVRVDEHLHELQSTGAGYYRLEGRGLLRLRRKQSVSSLLSQVADEAYSQAPVVRNELLNRHQLSSQAAKARRELLEHLLGHAGQEDLAIEGFGPEMAMYRSVLRSTGIHRPRGRRGWAVGKPDDRGGASFQPVWAALTGCLRAATDERLNMAALFERLSRPPFGLRFGVAPVLAVCALIEHADEVALYEHGTFKPVLTADLLERLVRNPQHFDVKHYASSAGPRQQFVEACAHVLSGMQGSGEVRPTVVGVVSAIVRQLSLLNDYARRTAHVSKEAQALREAALTATEPDVLLFDALPEALGGRRLRAGSTGSGANDLAPRLAEALQQLRSAYGQLLGIIRDDLAAALRAPRESLQLEMSVRSRPLAGRVLEPRLAAFTMALSAELDSDAWLEYVAMVVANTAPATWRDDDLARFRFAVSELGGGFRRLEALSADARAAAQGQGFRALMVTVTEADGNEHAQLVRIQDQHTEPLLPVLEAAMAAATAHLGDEQLAREALLALLAISRGSVSAAVQDAERLEPRSKRAKS